MGKETSVLAAAALMAFSCSRNKPDPWELVWTEDFDGPEIDAGVWTRVGRGSSDWNDMMSLREDLAGIEDGALVLKGIVNDGKGADTTAFLTAGVQSRGKQSFRSAKFEIRAKFSSARGFWPALWLMPDKELDWPDGGEIDIMEHLNHDSFVYQTLHSCYSKSVSEDDPPHGTTAPISLSDYNVYGVEVFKDSVCFFTNGKKVLTYPRVEALAKDGEYPFADHPFYLILSSQIQGEWVGNADPAEYPVEMRIDWVKVYRLRE